ncbi:MAG: DNA topoisomerase IV subunit A, partial [Gammaproteobacteria bacterium]
PYAVNKANLVMKFGDLVRERKLTPLVDVRDESTKDVRIVLEIKRDTDPELVMAYLYKHTPLQTNFGVNLTVLVPTKNAEVGAPKRLDLKSILRHFLDFRFDVVTRRFEFDLREVQKRLHILEGFEKVYDALDEMLKIIRKSDGKQDAAEKLIKRFKLSDEQAEEILNTRLRHLAKLEEMKIREEQKTLSAEREELEALLKSKAKLKKLIAAEIRADAEKYGDERRTKIIEREAAQAIDETTLIPNEPVTVVLSTGGWVRSAKGHDVEPGALSYKGGDAFKALARGRNLQSAVFIDSTGRTYTLPAHSLPSARGHGEPLSGRLDPPDGAKFAGVMIGEPEDLWLLASDAGYGFTARLKDLISDRRAGKTVLSVPENAQVLAPAPVPSPDSLVAVVSSEGKLLAFPVGEVPEMPRGKGNKLYDIPGKKARARTELMTAAAVVPPNASLVLWSGETGKVIEWRDLQAYVGERAQRGTVLKRGWPRNIDRMEARLPAQDGNKGDKAEKNDKSEKGVKSG